MKRKTFVTTIVAGLMVFGGPTALLFSEISSSFASEQNLEESHSEHAVEPDMPGMDHSDADMPGMDHSDADMPETNHSDPGAIETSANRPLKATLGVFGVATSIVLTSALFLRRRDEKLREIKVNARNNPGDAK